MKTYVHLHYRATPGFNTRDMSFVQSHRNPLSSLTTPKCEFHSSAVVVSWSSIMGLYVPFSLTRRGRQDQRYAFWRSIGSRTMGQAKSLATPWFVSLKTLTTIRLQATGRLILFVCMSHLRYVRNNVDNYVTVFVFIRFVAIGSCYQIPIAIWPHDPLDPSNGLLEVIDRNQDEDARV